MEAMPHIFITNDDKAVWLAETEAFVEVAALHHSEIGRDGSVDLGSSIAVVVQGPPDHVNENMLNS